MRRTSRAVIALVAAATLALPAPAEALVIAYPTSITAARTPTGVVDRGTVVTIYGRLISEKRACIRNSPIRLIRLADGKVWRTRTGRRGRYAFEIRATFTSRYRVRFPGKTLKVVHPDTYVCQASSTSLRIRVR